MKNETARMVVDMPAAEYHATDALSASGIKEFRRSPAHYRYAQDNPKPDKDAFRFGRAFHTLTLEPQKFDAECAVAPSVDKRTTAGKLAWSAFVSEHEGKTILSPEEAETASSMSKAVQAHPAARILLGSGAAEHSFFWADEATSAPCRARLDWLREDGLIVDLKTCRNAETEAFMRDAFNLGYHIQAAFYCEAYRQFFGREPAGFAFIAVEKEAPHGVSAFVADSYFIEAGEQVVRNVLPRYAECRNTGIWPAYADTIIPLGLPAWAQKQLENGETL